MKGIPKEKVKDLCPICHQKSLFRTFWGKASFTDIKSDETWRYCCTSKIKASFGIKLCYFNTPIIRLPIKYKGKINWSKIKHLTSLVHPVIKEAIDKAIEQNRFI